MHPQAQTLWRGPRWTLALLLACQREAQARGKQLRVTGAPPKLSQLAQLYGVAELLGL